MESNGTYPDEHRPDSSASGSGTDNTMTTLTSDFDEEQAHLLDSSSSGDPKNQPLLKNRKTKTQKFFYHLRQVLGFLLANWYKFVIVGLIITMIVLTSIKGFSVYGNILKWFKQHNDWGRWGIYIGLHTALVTFFFPVVVFIMGAGFVFGFWRGLLAVWIGGAVGQALSFILARYLLRDWVESFVQKKWAKWKYINMAIENEGWKLVLIMRLSPIIPYNLLNIAMATTSMHLLSFTIVSAIGIIFECAVFCYFGSMAGDVTSIVSGDAGPAKAIQWVLLGLSITMVIVGALFVSFMVKRAIKKAEEAGMNASTTSGHNNDNNDLSTRNGDGHEGSGSLETAQLLPSPTALERESYITSITGFGRVAEKAMFDLRPPTSLLSTPFTPERLPGTLQAHIRSASKAKYSPKAGNSPPTTPFKNRSGSDVQKDVEMGQKQQVMSANRRRSSILRVDTSDDEGGNG